MPARPQPGRLAARAALAGLAAGALALGLAGCESPTAPDRHVLVVDDRGHNQELRAFAPETTLDMPAVTLITPGGNPYPLRAKTAGKVALVYFGYTNCPDVCPATMATLATAVAQLPARLRAKIMILFVTTDPDRDTGPVLLAWVRRIDRSIVALGGTTEKVHDLAITMRVDPGVAEPLASGGYALTHSATVTAFTADGQARAVYPSTTTVVDWLHDLPILASTGVSP